MILMNEIPIGQPSEPAIHFRESASGLGCLLIIVSLFTAGAVAAVYNIAAVRPIEIGPLVASILWLMLIGAIVIPAYRKHGFQQIVVRLGGRDRGIRPDAFELAAPCSCSGI